MKQIVMSIHKIPDLGADTQQRIITNRRRRLTQDHKQTSEELNSIRTLAASLGITLFSNGDDKVPSCTMEEYTRFQAVAKPDMLSNCIQSPLLMGWMRRNLPEDTWIHDVGTPPQMRPVVRRALDMNHVQQTIECRSRSQQYALTPTQTPSEPAELATWENDELGDLMLWAGGVMEAYAKRLHKALALHYCAFMQYQALMQIIIDEESYYTPSGEYIDLTQNRI